MPLRLTGVITAGNMITFSDPLVGGSHRYALTTGSGLLFPVALHPAQPLQTSGGFTGADYVMIAPADFIPALNGLISLRQAQGLTIAVENVQAIYEAYGDGRPDPAAIRAYLAHAYTAWTPRPTYVVLVGDGSFDPRQYRAGSPPTFIPPYLADVDPWAGETAADNRYVTVDGADTLPDMLIGRLPVKTLTETQVVVKKIVQYETNPFPGGWNEQVTFVADNADEAGNFAAASEVLATAYVTSPFTSQRIYFTPPATTITATRQAVLNQWNAGAFIVQYTGHSSWATMGRRAIPSPGRPARAAQRAPLADCDRDDVLYRRISKAGADVRRGVTHTGWGRRCRCLGRNRSGSQYRPQQPGRRILSSRFQRHAEHAGAGHLGRQIVPGHYRPASRFTGYLYPFRGPGPQAKSDHHPMGQPELSAYCDEEPEHT